VMLSGEMEREGD